MAEHYPADPKADLRKGSRRYRDAMREVVKELPR